jgi:anti-sigma28 factor (negative regulator of flagellin synthesis)
MATSKKSSSKSKSSKKKTSAKKPTRAAAAAKQKLQFTLDPAKVEAIKACLAKGTLTVTVSKADLTRGRVRDPWLYD